MNQNQDPNLLIIIAAATKEILTKSKEPKEKLFFIVKILKLREKSTVNLENICFFFTVRHIFLETSKTKSIRKRMKSLQTKTAKGTFIALAASL